MIVGQLRNLIRAEAKIPDAEGMSVWIDETIQSELNLLTSLCRYPELRVDSALVSLALATQLVTIPAAQHIDLDEIYYLPSGDTQQAYLLFPHKNFVLVNEGKTETVIRKSATQFSLFPYGEIATGDKIQFTYWAYPTLANENAAIPVEALIEPLKQRVITRAILHTDSKLATFHRSLAKESYSMSLGSTDIEEG